MSVGWFDRPATHGATGAIGQSATRAMSRAIAAGWLLAVLSILSVAWAQSPANPQPSQTGDAWVDAALRDMDGYAARYPDAFADELTRYYAAPRDLLASLRDAHWTPGDIYFACALGRVAAQPCRAVAAWRSQDPALRWSQVAAHFGVAADAPAFHRLKRGIVQSYQHWARPLAVDASLHAEFPKHALDAGAAPTTRPKRSPAHSDRGKKRAR